MTSRGTPLVLTLTFLVIIFGVPLSQAIIDVTVEEEERPLALSLFSAEEPAEEPPPDQGQSWLRRSYTWVKGLLPPEEKLRDYEKLLEKSSIFEQKIRPAFQYARYVLLGELGEKATKGSGGWYFYTPGVRYLTEGYTGDLPERPDPDPVEVIADLRDQLRARGIQLLVVPIPGKASIYPDHLGEVAADPKVSANTERFRARLNRRGVANLDLHQIFRTARARPEAAAGSWAQGGALYMKTDTHWTGVGAQLTATAVARAVKAMPWYAKLPHPEHYARREVTVKRRGDVLRMTQIPRQEELFSVEQTRCAQVTLKKSGELYDEPDPPTEAPILVLGDSFSRVYQTDEPEAAGWIANLAYELQLPVSSIVNDGGASTLVRQELARSPALLKGKRLVIWAFVERDLRFGLLGWQRIKL